MSWSRREFLSRIGQAGGYSAAFVAMQGMGLIEARGAIRAESVAAPAGSGKGVKVVVLGGGIAGLVAAYELRALGYECTVLEARERPGGRNYTVRGGDTVSFMDGSKQTCAWGAGGYQNFGPARLPSIHPNMLGYCKKLGVELQVEVNMTNSAFLQNDAANAGKPVVMRQAVNDTRGHVSELLAKCVNQGALDADLVAGDKDRMLAFLRLYGSLDEAGKYNGSDRAGYAKDAGAGDDAGVLSTPIDMHTLLDENFWQGMLFDQQFDMQATMFQPVGGMDRIPYAFAKSLGAIVKYGAPVTEIRNTAKGVQVAYTQHGAAKQVTADYCICALPLTTLRKVPTDLRRPLQQGHRRVYLRQRLQGRLGKPPLLGAGLQHLRRPGVRQHRLLAHLVSLGRHVLRTRRRRQRLHRRERLTLCRAAARRQTCRVAQVHRASAPRPRQRA